MVHAARSANRRPAWVGSYNGRKGCLFRADVRLEKISLTPHSARGSARRATLTSPESAGSVLLCSGQDPPACNRIVPSRRVARGIGSKPGARASQLTLVLFSAIHLNWVQPIISIGIMRFFTPLGLLLGLTHALPQTAYSSCVTVTSTVTVPSTTYTGLSTYVTTTHATTADDLGTFTDVTTLSSTTTLETLTNTITACTKNGTVTVPHTKTVYTTAAPAPSAYERDILVERSASPCTVTKTSTYTSGAAYTEVPAHKTSTFTDYTAFTQATVTQTKSGGHAYVIATVTATASAVCGPTVTSSKTTTATYDARCAPSAMTSAYRGFGLNYNFAPDPGAGYRTTAKDAESCCQLCIHAHDCANSAWDIRNNACYLSFPVDYNTGALNCGLGSTLWYDPGPDSPMAPGTGLYVGLGCGSVEYFQSPPDDGT
nr:hypothetical protein CFP56_11010 [Quercus suber]